MLTGVSKMTSFSLVLRLPQVGNHGLDLLPAQLQEWVEQARFFSDQISPYLVSCEVCNVSLSQKDKELAILPCLHELCQMCIKWDGKYGKHTTPICPICKGSYYETTEKPPARMTQYLDPEYKPSSKVRALITNLQTDRKEAAQLNASAEKRYVLSKTEPMNID
jgi:hypothetical protein